MLRRRRWSASYPNLQQPKHNPLRSAETLDGYGRGQHRLLEGASMGDKSPKKDNAKKPAHSLKEKRAAKRDKQREERGFGTR